jgi:mannose-6-phosphate isomerase-like protein (cupin superfamily)
MLTVQFDQLALFDAWYEGETGPRWRGQFPTMGQDVMESLGTVYFEVNPGEALPVHTDSKDEIVILLSGSGEGTVGDEVETLNAPGMVFIPALVPHRFRNTGNETLRALGIFAGADVISTFEQDVMPIGVRVFGEEPLPIPK